MARPRRFSLNIRAETGPDRGIIQDTTPSDPPSTKGGPTHSGSLMLGQTDP
jgi:hypothetical protein